MYQRPLLLGQVRLAQSTPPPLTPLVPPAAAAPAPAPLPTVTKVANSAYVGGAVVAVMAALGALLA